MTDSDSSVGAAVSRFATEYSISGDAGEAAYMAVVALKPTERNRLVIDLRREEAVGSDLQDFFALPAGERQPALATALLNVAVEEPVIRQAVVARCAAWLVDD